MIVFGVVLLSAVQAITEFFPVSSSAHLVLLHDVISLGSINPFRFDLAVHAGTLIAVVIAFWGDIVRNARTPLGKWILLATILPVVVGAIFDTVFEDVFRTSRVAASMLVIGGFALLFAERFTKQERSVADLSFRDVFLVGLSQVIAFIPGVSRSGATIITALARNLKVEAAVRLSFLLSIPITFVAAADQIPHLLREPMPRTEAFALALGVVSAAVFGYVVIRVFLRFAATKSLAVFAWYRIALGLAVFLWAI